MVISRSNHYQLVVRDFPFVLCNSLFHFLGAEVQVAVADPLNLKPISVVVIPAATEIHLHQVQGPLHVAATRCVRVLVVLHAVLQPLGQSELQGDPHHEAKQGGEEQQGVEHHAKDQEGLQHGLPLYKLSRVQRVVADLASKGVDTTSYEAHEYEQVGQEVALVVVHEFGALPQLNLEEQAQAEDQDACQYRKPVHEPNRLSELHSLFQIKLDHHQSHGSTCNTSSSLKK